MKESIDVQVEVCLLQASGSRSNLPPFLWSLVYLPLFKWLPSSSVVKNLFKFTFGRMDIRLDATFVGLVSSHRGNSSCLCVYVDVDVCVDEVWVAISSLEPIVYLTHRWWWSRQRLSLDLLQVVCYSFSQLVLRSVDLANEKTCPPLNEKGFNLPSRKVFWSLSTIYFDKMT